MASARQIAANRRNAERSTGPRTEEGKARSRENATTHGLTGGAVVVDDAQEAKVAARLEGWRSAHRPSNPREEWLVRQAVVQSVRVDACQAAQAAERSRLAGRAGTSWDDDRKLDAEALGAQLPRRPSAVVARLRQSKQGAEWLLSRWKRLENALRDGRSWTAEQTGMASDLLGVPVELRAGEPWDDAGSPAALVAREVSLLVARLAGPLTSADAADRRASASGVELPGATGQPLARLRRYEAACWRQLLWAERQLKDDPAVGPGPVEVKPAPVAPPPRSLPEPIGTDRIVPMTEAECLAFERDYLGPFEQSLQALPPGAYPVPSGLAVSLSKRTQR